MMVNKYDSRGVIGLGEPPGLPGAAISTWLNAIGVRVLFLLLTPAVKQRWKSRDQLHESLRIR
jgi:hypothetical protein